MTVGSMYFHRDPVKLFPKATAPEFNHKERRVMAAQIKRMKRGREPVGPNLPMVFAMRRFGDFNQAQQFVQEVMLRDWSGA